MSQEQEHTTPEEIQRKVQEAFESLPPTSSVYIGIHLDSLGDKMEQRRLKQLEASRKPKHQKKKYLPI
jgi:hypothetical protein